MKRRNFLGLFGAAAATPFLPQISVARAAQAGAYSGAAMHGAILHAQTHSAFSVWNLAKSLKLPVTQAEALMGDLAKRGVIGPLQGTTFGGRWATSNVLLRDTLAASRAVRNSGANTKTDMKLANRRSEADLSELLAHLRKVAESYFAPQVA